MVIPIVIGALGTVTGTGGLGNKRTGRDHPNYIAQFPLDNLYHPVMSSRILSSC